MAYSLAVDINLGAGNPGLALTASLFDSAGNAAAGLTTTTLIEAAANSGSYLWTGTLPDGHRGYITFTSGGVFMTKVVINPQEVENADQKTSLVSGAIASASAIAAAVWAAATRTLTMTAAQVAAVLAGNTITLERGDTFTLPFTGLGSLAGRSKLWFTVKKQYDVPDTAAIVQVEETGGLLRLLGAAATANQGTLVVTDATTGALTVTLVALASALLEPGSSYLYDLQLLTGTTVRTLTSGSLTVVADITQVTS